MASRRFIQKFDRLSADAQQHLEQQIDVLYKLGYTRPIVAPSAVLPGDTRVLPFPRQDIRPAFHLFVAHGIKHCDLVLSMCRAALTSPEQDHPGLLDRLRRHTDQHRQGDLDRELEADLAPVQLQRGR